MNNQTIVQEEQLKAVLNSMVEGVIVLDKQGRILLVNKTIELIFNLKEKDIIGALPLEVIRNHDLDVLLRAVLENQLTKEAEIEMVTPVERVFRIRAAPFGEFSSERKGVIAILYDVTELRKLEKIRSEFVANVSHELKTPLVAIKGFIETLLEGAINDKKNNIKFLNIINEHVIRLERLINDLLELSRIESQKATLKDRSEDIKEIINYVLQILHAKIKKKKIIVEVKIPKNFPLVKIHRYKIELVLLNLLDNAIKFNKDSGSIVISGKSNEDKVIVTIEDTGIGIPEKDLPRIFERFYRVDKGRSRELGGTGLGLSIVKHIIELYEGSVSVESELEKGSKFSFTLPYK